MIGSCLHREISQDFLYSIKPTMKTEVFMKSMRSISVIVGVAFRCDAIIFMG